MVNEINKPSDGQASSNQTVIGVQAEHQQRMEEMEQVRVRSGQTQSIQTAAQQEHQEMEQVHEEYEQTVQETTMSSCSKAVVAEEVMQIRCTTTEEVIIEEVDADEGAAIEDATGKAQLAQRLATSNQALVDMQTEHKQLMQEMEQLRARAEQLQGVKTAQKEGLQQYEQSVEQSSTMSSSSKCSQSGVAQEVMKIRCTTTEEVTVEEVDADENPEEAEYIKAKLAELAKLKAQYSRVQNLMSTTDLIEKHLSKQSAASLADVKEAAESIRRTASSLAKQSSHDVVQQESSQSSRSSSSTITKQSSREIVQQQSSESQQSVSASSITKQASHEVMEQQSSQSVQCISSKSVKQASHEVVQQQSSESLQNVSSSTMKQASREVVQQQTTSSQSSSSSAVMESALEQSVSSNSTESTATDVDEKQQLLVAMIDMFQDFNNDLKSQAESIRSERERIKALKETIIRSKEPPK
ncbi:uncharacterized protein LOC142233178 [Haematobia irritans]|uniref:uncharacterized protein LOC142233178 n=1 Tax=Haematobia irritans TaxID=7368 RepID=UPI003F50D3D1